MPRQSTVSLLLLLILSSSVGVISGRFKRQGLAQGNGMVISSIFQIPIATLGAVHDLVQNSRIRMGQVQQYYAQQQAAQQQQQASQQQSVLAQALAYQQQHGLLAQALGYQQPHRLGHKLHFHNSKALVQPRHQPPSSKQQSKPPSASYNSKALVQPKNNPTKHNSKIAGKKP